MQLTLIILLSTLLLAAILGATILPRIVHLSHELHLYDLPDSRKVHKLPIPRLGGVAFLPSVLIAIATVGALSSRLFGGTAEGVMGLEGIGTPQHFIAYLAGSLMLYTMGIYDDIHGVNYKIKFVIQVLAATLLCISGLWIASMRGILGIDRMTWWIGMPLTILFVVYLTNAMNLIDGIDGLASGLSLISFAVALILCMLSRDLFWAMMAAANLGVLLSFFFFNVYGQKNKIFMGDAGSLTLGYTLSFMVLHFWQAQPVEVPVFHNTGIVILSTLIIPMFDVVRVMMSRLRDGRNPFLPDKNHIHHKLLRTGLSGRGTMVTILGLSLVFIGGNYAVATYLNPTLILLLDIILYVLMHLIINWFIRRKEGPTYNWNREL